MCLKRKMPLPMLRRPRANESCPCTTLVQVAKLQAELSRLNASLREALREKVHSHARTPPPRQTLPPILLSINT
jgi:hypothetical protein